MMFTMAVQNTMRRQCREVCESVRNERYAANHSMLLSLNHTKHCGNAPRLHASRYDPRILRAAAGHKILPSITGQSSHEQHRYDEDERFAPKHRSFNKHQVLAPILSNAKDPDPISSDTTANPLCSTQLDDDYKALAFVTLSKRPSKLTLYATDQSVIHLVEPTQEHGVAIDSPI